MANLCLFCGGDSSEPDHARHCDGRQGAIEARAQELGFTVPGTGPDHDGATYTHEVDHVRLNAQTLRVWEAMRSGHWWTLADLRIQTGDPEASISARLRDLRKPKFGGHTIDRARVGAERGLFMYRLVIAERLAS